MTRAIPVLITLFAGLCLPASEPILGRWLTENGSAQISAPNQLDVRGYLGISLLGRWTRKP